MRTKVVVVVDYRNHLMFFSMNDFRFETDSRCGYSSSMILISLLANGIAVLGSLRNDGSRICSPSLALSKALHSRTMCSSVPLIRLQNEHIPVIHLPLSSGVRVL